MSAMSASSGLMPLSLISEHKAAQGGPPPVQPLSFAAEKHPLVQAPKPTPNGMEPSPPLVPVLPPPQPESHPSLPCGGVIEPANEEERSGGAVPEVQPLEPSPPAVPTVPEQQPAAEPPTAPETAVSKASPTPSTIQAMTQPSASTNIAPVQSPAPQLAPSLQSSQAQQPPSPAQPVSSQPQTQEESPALTKPQSQVATQPEPAVAQAASDSEKSTQPDTAVHNQVKTPSEPQEEKQSETLTEQTLTELPAPQQQAKSETVSIPQPTPASSVASVGRPSKRTKNSNSGTEKKNAPAPVVNTTTTETEGSDDKKAKRKRLPTQVYQSPIPELNLIAKMSKTERAPAPDDKLIVFYRNEFLAVRNAEGSFYVCQAMQNVYKSSSRIRIRWLSQVPNTDHYSPDFYDNTEFDCILTNLNLERIEKNKYRLPKVEDQRTQNILKRAIDVEKGIAPPEEATVTEEHPDGLDLSLYQNEDQLKKRKKGNKNRISKRKVKKTVPETTRKSREANRRKPIVVEQKKSVNPVVSQPLVKRVARIPGKVEKPVVQRIVAAKKMGRRKVASSTVTNKAAPAAQAIKEIPKKKEVSRGAALKRKSTEPQAPPVPEKKVKTGASKTRNL